MAAEFDTPVASVSMHRTLGFAELAAGRPEVAVRHFELALSADGRSTTGLCVVPDLVEAAMRAGTPNRARDPLVRFESWANSSRSPLLLALAARARALLSSGSGAEDEFLRALDLHARTEDAVERAHTQLLYGEYLRRAGRRTDARQLLRTALDSFQQVDALTWADRARAELLATAPTNGHRSAAWSELTAQQHRVVAAVSEGASNREVAARLFLSPRTVDYHLRNVYIKLGIKSRSELIRHTLTAHPITDARLTRPTRAVSKLANRAVDLGVDVVGHSVEPGE